MYVYGPSMHEYAQANYAQWLRYITMIKKTVPTETFIIPRG